jgi:hypothetical protein
MMQDHPLHVLEIVSRGSLLFAVSQLWTREHLSEQVDTITSASVIGLFVRTEYLRQSDKTNRPPHELQFMILNESERAFFMRGIACYMATHALPNLIGPEDFNCVVRQLYHVIPDKVSEDVSPKTTEPRTPLRERMQTVPHAIESVETDVRTCGLLVPDLSTPGALRFAHKSFMEYLVAATLAPPPSTHTKEAGVRGTGAREALFCTMDLDYGALLRLPEAVVHFAELLDPSTPKLRQLRMDPLVQPGMVDKMLGYMEWTIKCMGLGGKRELIASSQMVNRQVLAGISELVRSGEASAADYPDWVIIQTSYACLFWRILWDG